MLVTGARPEIVTRMAEADDHRRHAADIGRQPDRIKSLPARTHVQQHDDARQQHQRPSKTERRPMVVCHFQVDLVRRRVGAEFRADLADDADELVRGLVELGGRAGQIGRPESDKTCRGGRGSRRRDRSGRPSATARGPPARSTVYPSSRAPEGFPGGGPRDGPRRPASARTGRRPASRTAKVRFLA